VSQSIQPFAKQLSHSTSTFCLYRLPNYEIVHMSQRFVNSQLIRDTVVLIPLFLRSCVLR